MPFLLAINICMRTILCATLIDITETGVIRGESQERDQQRNWQTVLQVLSLKTQPEIVHTPGLLKAEEIDRFFFGDDFHDKHNVWVFAFRSANHGGGYSIEELTNDFEQVPVILGLDETARMLLPLFFTRGTMKNIYFVEQR